LGKFDKPMRPTTGGALGTNRPVAGPVH